MTRAWIGIADDVTEQGVTGAPCPGPRASMPAPTPVATPPQRSAGSKRVGLVFIGLLLAGLGTALRTPLREMIPGREQTTTAGATDDSESSSPRNLLTPRVSPSAANSDANASGPRPSIPHRAPPAHRSGDPAAGKPRHKQTPKPPPASAPSDAPASAATADSPPGSSTKTAIDPERYRRLTERIR